MVEVAVTDDCHLEQESARYSGTKMEIADVKSSYVEIVLKLAEIRATKVLIQERGISPERRHSL